MTEERWVKMCWEEKKKLEWKDQYSKERERFYNRNGWSNIVLEELSETDENFEENLREREKDVQIQLEDSRIREARYNC